MLNSTSTTNAQPLTAAASNPAQSPRRMNKLSSSAPNFHFNNPMKLFLKIIALLFATSVLAAEPLTLLNVSYDPTREFYQEINTAFIKDWRQKTGQTVAVNQ